MMETIIPLWESDETGALVSLRLMPVELVMKGNKSEIGLPRKASDLGFIERLREISKPYGIEMNIENDGIVSCKW